MTTVQLSFSEQNTMLTRFVLVSGIVLLNGASAVALAQAPANADRVATGSLTDSEKQLAIDAGFDPVVLEEVKAGGGKDLQLVKYDSADLNGAQADPFFQEHFDSDGTPLPEDTAALEKVVRDYPELKDSVYPKPPVFPARGPVKQDPAAQSAMTKMLNENPELKKALERATKSEISVQTQKPHFQGKAIGFLLQRSIWASRDSLELVDSLQNVLRPLGYQVYATTEKRITRRCASLEEAEKFMKETGTLRDSLRFEEYPAFSREVVFDPTLTEEQRNEQLFGTADAPKHPTVEEQLSHAIGIRNSQQSLDSEKAMISKTAELTAAAGGKIFPRNGIFGFFAGNAYRRLLIEPGAVVEKLSKDHWRITTPARWTVHAEMLRALVFKGMNQFDFLAFVGGDEVREYVTFVRGNEVTRLDSGRQTVKKMKELDATYGISILEVSGRRVVTFKLNRLPSDLSPLCASLYGGDNRSSTSGFDDLAASMRSTASRLRRDRRVILNLE
jgi:hypothetical protein